MGCSGQRLNGMSHVMTKRALRQLTNANTKCAYQPAHPYSLINAFISRHLDQYDASTLFSLFFRNCRTHGCLFS